MCDCQGVEALISNLQSHLLADDRAITRNIKSALAKVFNQLSSRMWLEVTRDLTDRLASRETMEGLVLCMKECPAEMVEAVAKLLDIKLDYRFGRCFVDCGGLESVMSILMSAEATDEDSIAGFLNFLFKYGRHPRWDKVIGRLLYGNMEGLVYCDGLGALVGTITTAGEGTEVHRIAASKLLHIMDSTLLHMVDKLSPDDVTPHLLIPLISYLNAVPSTSPDIYKLIARTLVCHADTTQSQFVQRGGIEALVSKLAQGQLDSMIPLVAALSRYSTMVVSEEIRERFAKCRGVETWISVVKALPSEDTWSQNARYGLYTALDAPWSDAVCKVVRNEFAECGVIDDLVSLMAVRTDQWMEIVRSREPEVPVESSARLSIIRQLLDCGGVEIVATRIASGMWDHP
eukprot:GFYU01048164.1.p1 GENE.GFYU01048164.1~~GFYU01048164.1.p1  ORF type:complete len:403 (-),score=48.50 GFYU01048164.1:155-1363(-)